MHVFLPISAVMVLLVPPSASSEVRAMRHIAAYCILHPVYAAFLLGCNLYSTNDCGLDISNRFAGGALAWGWLLALPLLSFMEATWRLIHFRKLHTFRSGMGDDSLSNKVLIYGMRLTGVLICISVLLYVLEVVTR